MSSRMACDSGTRAAPAIPCNTRDDHRLRQRHGQAAQGGGDGEAEDRHHEQPPPAEAGGEPAGGRGHDRRGDDVGGEHPGALVVAAGEGAGHVGQGDVGDGGVQRLHHGRQHGADGDHRHAGDCWMRFGHGMRVPSGSCEIRHSAQREVREPRPIRAAQRSRRRSNILSFGPRLGELLPAQEDKSLHVKVRESHQKYSDYIPFRP